MRLSMLAVATSWTRFIRELKEFSVEEHAFGIHGGDIETSVILALMPDAVDMTKANDFPNLQERLALDYKHLRAYGPHAFGWKAADLNPLGVTGNAGAASPAKGNLLLKSATNGVLDVLADQIAQLGDALGLERQTSQGLRTQVGQLTSNLQDSRNEREAQASLIASLSSQLETREGELDAARTRITGFE